MYCVPSAEICGSSAASRGVTFHFESKVYSVSNTCWVIMPTRSAVETIGSSVGGSPTVATLMTWPPPDAARASDGATAVHRPAIAKSRRVSLMVVLPARRPREGSRSTIMEYRVLLRNRLAADVPCVNSASGGPAIPLGGHSGLRALSGRKPIGLLSRSRPHVPSRRRGAKRHGSSLHAG